MGKTRVLSIGRSSSHPKKLSLPTKTSDNYSTTQNSVYSRLQNSCHACGFRKVGVANQKMFLHESVARITSPPQN